MTKLIAAFIIIVVLYGGWHLFLYWVQIRDEGETKHKQEAAAMVVGESLSGIPDNLVASLQAARKKGPNAMKTWLKNYGRLVQDPRKAWIELDYCVMVSREDLTEARRVFAEVKARTPPTSPVWTRVKELEKTYE
ncbi:MAG: hypothetical protein WCL11_07735 [Verrucomicrobiota bacterium]|nr:hypothetical protein [Verrucomicrobiota bacterium]